MARPAKRSVAVTLPSEFIDFICQIQQRIIRGDASATTTESDDLLQCDCAYGGLYDVDEKRFGFRYSPIDDVTWDIDLDANQIAQIADGRVTELKLWQCEDETCECLHAAEDAYCINCDSVRHIFDVETTVRERFPRESPEILSMLVSLRHISIALHEYHRVHGCFPPPITRDEEGRPMHSWRSLLLPFLDEEELFRQIDFNQPWDSEPNQQLWDRRPAVFHTPGSISPMTSLVAVVDPNTIWPPVGIRKSGEIRTGHSYTTTALCLPDFMVNWMQPLDADVATVVESYEKNKELVAAIADSNVITIRDVDALGLRKLLCIDVISET